MNQISLTNVSGSAAGRYLRARQRVADAIKWWAEHQAWPATDEIRVDRNRSTCG